MPQCASTSRGRAFAGVFRSAISRLASAAKTAVRGRRKGYAPHKFYGSWRLFELGEADEEPGERAEDELQSRVSVLSEKAATL